VTPKPANMSGIYVGFSQIPVSVAIIIESRSDDNMPSKGSIQTDASASANDYMSMIDGPPINLYFTL
jgi:hypothetical protein